MAKGLMKSDIKELVQEQTSEAVKTKKPQLYRVLLHNDDYTTQDFVVEILMDVFHLPEMEAFRVMMMVHRQGLGLAGVFTKEIAEAKIKKAEAMATQQEFPLRLSMEPESNSD